MGDVIDFEGAFHNPNDADVNRVAARGGLRRSERRKVSPAVCAHANQNFRPGDRNRINGRMPPGKRASQNHPHRTRAQEGVVRMFLGMQDDVPYGSRERQRINLQRRRLDRHTSFGKLIGELRECPPPHRRRGQQENAGREQEEKNQQAPKPETKQPASSTQHDRIG